MATLIQPEPEVGIPARMRPDGDHRIWVGTVSKGVCIYRGNGNYITVTKWIWERENGPTPDGKFIRPTCGEPLCVAPGHLAAVTARDLRNHPGKADSKAAAYADGTVIERALAMTSSTPSPDGVEGDCLMWTGKIDSKGYGLIRDHRDGYTHEWRAHRFIYEKTVGEIDANLDLDHLCHNADETCPGGPKCPHRACVNTAHLAPKGRRDNLLAGKSLAARATDTHCARGHEFTPENTYVSHPKGRGPRRQCKACVRLRQAR